MNVEDEHERIGPAHRKTHPFYPHHVLDEMMIVVALAGVVLTLALLLPFHLHDKADPMFTPPGIKPEWYFLPMYQAIKYVPRTVGVMLTGLVFVLIIAWPFVDMLLDRLSPRRPLYRLLGVIAIVMALLFGGLGHISETEVHVFGRQYHFDLKGIPHSVTEGETQPHVPQQK